MNTPRHPTKEQVREYLQRRFKARTPPPDPEQIKHELGMGLTEVRRARNFRIAPFF